MNLQAKSMDYSMKNIPMPSQQAYKKCLLRKVESVIRRMRIKVESIKYDKPNENLRNFGFKSNYAPPKSEYLNAFEKDLYDMVKNVKFTKFYDRFINELNEEVKSIKRSPNLIIPADKTSNYYEINNDDYKKLLNDNITKSYKKVNKDEVNNINKKAKEIASNLELDSRIQCYAERPAFVYIKDHKENFPNTVKCRLINPAKSEIGKISKSILDDINKIVREKTKFLQWRNTDSVIDWFKNINDKEKCVFLKFDIADFYPSITKKLLTDSINFARNYVEITDEEEEIIMHAKEALLFHENSAWRKKSVEPGNFDVTMGSFDGSETAEIVGLFILNKLSLKFGIECVGLYRDDGLALMKNVTGPRAERMKKDLIKIFKTFNLKITAETNLKGTDFLDVYFNLQNGKYKPYHKPNDVPRYVHAKSNHPPVILKRIPEMIEKRVSNLSYDEDEFNKSKRFYENALKKSGYNVKLKYNSTPSSKQQKRKTRTAEGGATPRQ